MSINALMPAGLINFASQNIETTLSSLNTDATLGLSSTEADNRLKQYGLNIISVTKKMTWWADLLMHFKSPLVLLLLIATIISYGVGETINASIIFAIVLASVGTDFFQERSAGNAAEKLKQIVKAKAIVIRDGTEKEIFPQEICIGDIILLNAGKIVPADVRIVNAKDFFVNQSSLTGESFPNEKHADAIAEITNDLSRMTNMAFMGSSVITGTAKVVVVQTGASTEFGKIAEKLTEREAETDFGRGMRMFGYLIMKVTIALVLFIFLINALTKQNILDSFIFSIAIAVGLTPELLPMIMSLTMSKGSLQMAKKGVIVKHLSAIPNFGSMEVLCTDKTGTLTEDKIKLIKCVDVSGKDSDNIFQLAYLNSVFQTGIKNPLDDAILSHKKMDITSYKKIDEIPFDFFRKRMSVVVQKNNEATLICKGAPEEILKVCTQEKKFVEEAVKQYEALSADGFRVVAIAVKNANDKQIFSKQDETQLSFEGFVAFLDPPKEDAAEVIKELALIGVEVKIITGDNHLVTQKICHELLLPVKGIMQGYEMDTLTDDALQKRVMKTTIFSRFSPNQKNRVINALKASHHAVGYMGDGINDAPSLKAADIGISVNSATDVAKESAGIILTEKNLLVLKEGILEGRKTFGNTMKYILMGLSSNFGNMFSVAAATLFLPFLPMLPVQILINNFLYDTSQVAIPSDNVDDTYITRPQRWNIKMIYRYMFIFGITSSVFDMITFWLLYQYFGVDVAKFRTGWFMESLATQILVVFIIRTQHVPFFKSRPSPKLIFSVLVCLFIGWLLPYMPFAAKIGFEILPMHIIAYIIVLVIIYLFSAELVKRFIYNHLQKK
ncbi:MAG TPA: magnesium-translocating P-type ATPase [Hanamia sp.]|nr:magnesium-translocating P-type ATPase [Hanamia sp.]